MVSAVRCAGRPRRPGRDAQQERCGTTTSPSTTRRSPRRRADLAPLRRHDAPRRGRPAGSRTSREWGTGRAHAAVRRRGAAAGQGRRRRPRSTAAGVAPGDVGLFAVVLVHRLRDARGSTSCWPATSACRPSVQRLLVGHMGCYAAIPGAGRGQRLGRSRGLTGGAALPRADSACTSSRRGPDDIAAGGRARAVLRRRGGRRAHARRGRARGASTSPPTTDVDRADDMTWDVTDLGFRMGLSPRVPDVLAVHVGGVVDELLEPARAAPSPTCAAGRCTRAGRASSTSCEEQLGLADDAAGRVARGARRVRQLLVGDRAARPGPAAPTSDPPPGDAVVALAFGPGLTLYGALLRAT